MTENDLHVLTSSYQRLVHDMVSMAYSDKQLRDERSREFERLILLERGGIHSSPSAIQFLQKRVSKQLARSLTRFAKTTAFEEHRLQLIQMGKAALTGSSSVELIPIIRQANWILFASKA